MRLSNPGQSSRPVTDWTSNPLGQANLVLHGIPWDTLTYPSIASDIPLHTLVELLESEEVSVTWHTLEYPIGVKYGLIHLYIIFLNSVI